jgi:hypothetical protein
MSDELTPEALSRKVLENTKTNLDELRSIKFLIACQKAIDENDDFDTAYLAAKVYLGLILKFPDMKV